MGRVGCWGREGKRAGRWHRSQILLLSCSEPGFETLALLCHFYQMEHPQPRSGVSGAQERKGNQTHISWHKHLFDYKSWPLSRRKQTISPAKGGPGSLHSTSW